jgi:hypothetical protein
MCNFRLIQPDPICSPDSWLDKRMGLKWFYDMIQPIRLNSRMFLGFPKYKEIDLEWISKNLIGLYIYYLGELSGHFFV